MDGIKPRIIIISTALALIVLFLAYAFWPRAIRVDIAAAAYKHMQLTINEEAKTRVRDAYVVSAPVTGRLLRVEVEPGDHVDRNQSIVARMLPANPAVLDIRTEEQAKAAVDAADAALVLARAEVNRAAADADYATLEIERARKLRESDTVSQAALDQAERAWRAANAALETAKAAVAVRKADLENAQAMLMTFSQAEKLALGVNPHPRESIPLMAPITGRILRVIQESETTISAGAPILEIGDPSDDLEIVSELLSTDAVKITPGDRVIVEKWGGDATLRGIVGKVEPWGFTKFSALGVEEQRVNVIINFADNHDAHARLGHGFRVEVKIVIWEDENALTIPSSAIFRSAQDWAVFKVVKGRAKLSKLQIGPNNGVDTQILEGLEEGDEIILYPANQIFDGARVAQRKLRG